ncbi:unnamed protein product, partial [Phaeothamnion confervicola]
LTQTTGLNIFLEVDVAAEELMVKMAYKGNSWLGFAAATSGAGKMNGADAVVGDPNAATPSIRRYTLGNHLPGSLQAGVYQRQLRNATVSTAGAYTVLEFRRPIAASGDDGVEIRSGDNTFLWAYGQPGASFTARHKERNAYTVNLSA